MHLEMAECHIPFSSHYKTNILPFVTYNNLRVGVIEIIDHKNTIAIFHALVKILGDFLRIRRITLHTTCTCTTVRSMRLL